jgi:hypothetical protein
VPWARSSSGAERKSILDSAIGIPIAGHLRLGASTTSFHRPGPAGQPFPTGPFRRPRMGFCKTGKAETHARLGRRRLQSRRQSASCVMQTLQTNKPSSGGARQTLLTVNPITSHRLQRSRTTDRPAGKPHRQGLHGASPGLTKVRQYRANPASQLLRQGCLECLAQGFAIKTRLCLCGC